MPIVRGVQRVRGNSIWKGHFSSEVYKYQTNYDVAQLNR